MKTVKLEVQSLDSALEDFKTAFRTGRNNREDRICFDNVALLWQVLTEKRWEILQVMTGAGALSLREVARRVNRDVKSVHRDVHALLNAGIIIKSENGRIKFPYDTVHVDFTLKAA